jgi:UDP-N-acetylmuramoyl-tripeptide--D-alanyl-D-alanine ligase
MRTGVAEERMQALSVREVAVATGGEASGPGDQTLSGVSIDSRTLKPGELFVAIRGPRFDGHDYVHEAIARGAAAVLVHRDLPAPPGMPAVRVPDTTRALGDLARARRAQAGIPLVAITGSTGKTSTKEMTAALAESLGPVLKTPGNLNNRYGLPLALLQLEARHRVAVLELGMSAAGELRALAAIAAPDVAVITNVSAAHLENFTSVRAIAEAKAEILEGIASDGVAVLNHDDPELRRVGEGRSGPVIWFGRSRRCDVSAERWRGTIFGMRFSLRIAGRVLDVALPLAGHHHMGNFLAAAAAAHRLGVDPEAIAEGALRIRPAARRGHVLRLGHGVTLLDDSYNASPAAVVAAVAALDLAPRGRRVAFLGDMLELGASGPERHERTGGQIAGHVDVLVGVGPLAARLLDGAERAGLPGSRCHRFEDAAAAAASAAELVAAGDAVLVKGSRGVSMERIADALREHFGTAGE